MAGFNCLLSKLCSTSCIAGIPIHLCLFLVLLSDTKICVCGKCNQSIDREALLWHYTQNRLNRRLLIKEAICHSFSLSVFLSLLSLSLSAPPHTLMLQIFIALREGEALMPVNLCDDSFVASLVAQKRRQANSCFARALSGKRQASYRMQLLASPSAILISTKWRDRPGAAEKLITPDQSASSPNMTSTQADLFDTRLWYYCHTRSIFLLINSSRKVKMESPKYSYS